MIDELESKVIKELENKIRLQEIGTIKIGTKGEERKKKDGSGTFRLPQKLDYFSVVTRQKDASGNFIIDRAIMSKLGGDKPTEIPVRLLYDDIDLNFETSYVLYHGNKCLCRGDGELAMRNKKDGSREEIECNRETCQFAQSRQCKPFGRLQVLLEISNTLGGVHYFRTTSWHTINNIVSSLRLIQMTTGGILAGIPLIMTLQPSTVVPEKLEKAVTIYTVNLVYRGGLQNLLDTTLDISKRRTVAGIELKRIQERARQLQLKAPETEEDVQDIVEEFYPESHDAEQVDFEEVSESIESQSEKPDDVPAAKPVIAESPKPEPKTKIENLFPDEPKQPKPKNSDEKKGNGKTTLEELLF